MWPRCRPPACKPVPRRPRWKNWLPPTNLNSLSAIFLKPSRNRDDLPKPVKQRVMDSLLQMKTAQLDGCTVRRADDSDAWLVVGSDGQSRGKITLTTAFISGVKAMVPLRVQWQNSTQTYIVTMHLDGDEWRIDDFGP